MKPLLSIIYNSYVLQSNDDNREMQNTATTPVRLELFCGDFVFGPAKSEPHKANSDNNDTFGRRGGNKQKRLKGYNLVKYSPTFYRDVQL